MMHSLVTYLLLSVVLVGCSKEKPPADTMPRETFIQLYIDLVIAGESGQLSNDSTAKKFIDSLYAHYNVTDTLVRKTIEDYSSDLHRWKDFYDEVARRLEAKQKEGQAKKSI